MKTLIKKLFSVILAVTVLTCSLFTGGIVISSDAASSVDDLSGLNVVYANDYISQIAPTKGTGTEVDPYIIENASHFRYIAQKSTPATTYGKYYKVDPDIDIMVFQKEAYINAVAGSLANFLALDAEGVRDALSTEDGRIQYQSGTSGSSDSSYDSFAGTIDFSGVTICGMYNKNGGLIAVANGGATFKNLTLCNNVIESGWYNGNLVGYVHNGSASYDEYKPLTISNIVIHNCYQTTTGRGWANTGVLLGTAVNSKNMPLRFSNILTYDNISLGTVSTSDTTMMDCALFGTLPSSWNGDADGYPNANYDNIVTLDCVPYPIAEINNQSTKPAYWDCVYTTMLDADNREPCTWNQTGDQWNLFDITKIDGADLALGINAVTNMPKLDWKNTWIAIDGKYPELQAFHNFVFINNGDGTHAKQCDDCGLASAGCSNDSIVTVKLYDATCTEAAWYYDECTTCGLTTENYQKGKPLDHNVQTFDAIAHTCTEDGVLGFLYCDVCFLATTEDGSIEATLNIDQENYDIQDLIAAAIEAGFVDPAAHTATLDGEEIVYVMDEQGHSKSCSVCGESYDTEIHLGESVSYGESGHAIACEICGFVVDQAVPHVFNQDSVCDTCFYECEHTDNYVYNDAGDCVTAPTTLYICKLCGRQETVTTGDAPGHTADEAVVEDKINSTCSTTGSYYSVVYCAECGDELSREYVVIEKLPHTEGATVVENYVKETCETDGSYDNVAYCTVCGNQALRETVIVNATGHTVLEKDGKLVYSTERNYHYTVCATCSKKLDGEACTLVDDICTVCGAKSTAAKVVYVEGSGINQTAPTKGTGTEADPFIIENASHMRYIVQKSTPATTYGVYYKVDPTIDIMVFQTESYINSVAGSLDAFLALDAEGTKAALSNTTGRIQLQSGSAASNYDSFAGNIDFSGVTICGMYNENGGLISVANGGATLKNLTLCNNYIKSGWYNGNLVGYVHHGTATTEEYRPLTISNVVIHDCYQTTTGNGYGNTGVLMGTAINSKNIPMNISNILTYDNISLGQKSSSDTTMMNCALYGTLPSSWSGEADGVANASYSNIVTLDCVPYPTSSINNQCTKPDFWSNVYTTMLDAANRTPCTFFAGKDKWSLFDITKIDSADLALGANAKINMPELDWANVWVAVDGKYLELQAFHNFVYTDNGNGTHTIKCDDCSIVSGVIAHNFVNGICACGYTAKCGEVIVFWDGSSDASLADNGEAGTAGDPIIIDTAAELNYLANNVTGYSDAGKKYYKMADGIDTVILQPESIATIDADANGIYDILEIADGAVTKAYFEAIGVSNLANWAAKDTETWFAGTFDGNNIEFVGMYAKARSVGLFPTVDGGATFKNLAVVNSYIHGSKNSNDGTRSDGQSRTGAIAGGTCGYKYGAKVAGTVTFENIIVANNNLYTERALTSSAIVLGSDNSEEAAVINNAIVYGNNTACAEASFAKFTLTNGGGRLYSNTGVDTPSISNVIVLGAAPYNNYIKSAEYFTNVYTDADATAYAEANIKNVAGLTGAELAAACDKLDWQGTFLATDSMPEFYSFHRAVITDNGDGTHNLICTCGIELLNQKHVWVDAVCIVCDFTCVHTGAPDFVVKTEANCTSAAIGDVVCATCRKVLATNVQSGELGDHDLVYNEGMEPTCTYKGYTDFYFCEQCECVFKIDDTTTPVEEPYDELILPALGHNAGETVVENEVNATCTENGAYDEVVYCTVCDEELSRDTVTVDALGHTEGEIVIENEVEPTCTENGAYDEVVYCTVCDEELSRETVTVDALGHNAGEAVIENEVEPTCTENGSYDNVVYCDVCGEEISRETIAVEADGHTLATKYNESVHWNECTVCEEVLNETAHTMVDTEVEGGIQSDCECGYSIFTAAATDEGGNVGIDTEPGAFPTGTEIIFELINELHGHFEAIKEILKEISSNFVAYDITPSNPLNDGKEAELSFAIPEGFSSDVAIYYVNEQTGEYERLETEVRNGRAHAKTKHFSTYVLVDENTNPPAFVVETDGVMVTGSTITVTISAINNPGIISTMLSLNYDTSVLELVNAEGGQFTDVNFGPFENEPLKIFWADATGENHTDDGVVATLTFNVKADAAIGTTEITLDYDANSTFNYDLEYVTFETQGATAKVVDYLAGDVNGDGEIDMMDTGMMMRYILGWDIEINTDAADVDADGKVNNMDYVLLGRYIAGWDVELKYLY